MEKRKINRFCEVTALVLALAALLTLIGTGLTERVHLGTWGGKTEAVVFLPISPVQGAALLLGGMLAALALFALLKRHARLGWALAALWGAAAAILAVGFGTKQVYDAAIVQEAAELFARGNYKMMSADYLNAYPYQLGICLPMEILLRLFPGLNLNLTMQLVNVAMALGAAVAMAALGRTIFEDSRISRACEAAGLLVWPALLFCQQVYGTIPMLFFVSLAMLCYAKYVKTRRRALGAAFACLLALAYAAKINAAVALIAVTICSVLDALENRKLEPLAYAALAIALSLLLLRAIIWQYERRSGVTLNSGIGALARLTMGMQEGGGAAGWFNRYTERFFPLEVTARQQHDIALADLKARLAEMAQNPAQTVDGTDDGHALERRAQRTYRCIWRGGGALLRKGSHGAGNAAGRIPAGALCVLRGGHHRYASRQEAERDLPAAASDFFRRGIVPPAVRGKIAVRVSLCCAAAAGGGAGNLPDRGWIERKKSMRVVRMLHRAALAAFVLLLAALTLCALALTAQNGVGDNRMLQVVTLARQPFLKSLSLSLCMLAALAGIHVLLEKIGGVRLNAGLCALWLAAAVFWIWAIGMRQRADAQLVMADASQFARGYYGALSEDYLQVYTYQLGLCLPLHVLAKLLSGPALGQLDFAAQCLNAALGIAGAGVLAALAQEIFEKRAALAALLLYIVSLPTLLFAQFVYNINLMILLCAGTMLCFARYVRTGRVGFGAGYALLGGLALAAKPNAAVVLLALFICALMHGWARKDGKIVLFAALSFAIGKGALAAVTAWYAQKGGVTFRANVSMWARLAMGMQESPIAAGWYNNYTERFFSADVTAEQEKAQTLADIGAQLCRMRENPAAALAFYREKLLTQWLEPACDMLWSGQLSEKAGRYTGVIRGIYGAPGALRGWMEGYMDAMQTAVYALAAVGGVCALRKKGGAALLMIPVTVLGGALYHLIFEAKAQYAYPYMVYMLPLAAAGLCRLEDGAARLICSGKKWVQRRAECARTSHRD